MPNNGIIKNRTFKDVAKAQFSF